MPAPRPSSRVAQGLRISIYFHLGGLDLSPAVPGFHRNREAPFFNAGAGTGPINVPVHREWQATPGADYGSDTLLVSMRPAFVGTPGLYQRVRRSVHNFALGSAGSRTKTAAHLQFRNPHSGRIWPVAGFGPVVYPVWPGYSSGPYPEDSLMGGEVWKDNGDGTFTHEDARVWPSGLSALDLYVMGMIPPTEVPETFLLTDVQETDRWGTVRATKVPVRIEDIVAAMGPRVPAADAAQREFSLGSICCTRMLDHRGRICWSALAPSPWRFPSTSPGRPVAACGWFRQRVLPGSTRRWPVGTRKRADRHWRPASGADRREKRSGRLTAGRALRWQHRWSGWTGGPHIADGHPVKLGGSSTSVPPA